MSDTPRARALGKELRSARAESGLTMRQVGSLIGCSEAKVSRLETARRRLSPPTVRAFLDALDVRGGERDRLLRMAHDIDRTAWWESGGGLPAQLTELADAESRAVRITELSEVLIPGLLQIPEYSRALFAATEVEPQHRDRLVAARLARQQILNEPEPVRYLVLLDEAALRRAVGGRLVMADQLRAVLKTARLPNVTLQVMPFSLGAHTGLDGPFLLLEFERSKPLVHLEQRRCGAFLDAPEDVTPFQRARSTLCRTAMSPARSADLVAAYADAYEREEDTGDGRREALAEVELQR
ncbi:helix-turn-helix domain-containing protein [Saccharopolyspora sp. HNM0986]|uniref:helix-turn-helix domain-containing protein n=1 Tax=Saccharopolyspora galaxeae TaxID=2781241 RepID=UPI0019091AF9|nr:helix-turn-helix transcriptional regulator [Saccharopolyspora sp. HNM0986]MBK0865776.1 helix-turn-helix domain-containing protein [Saccharopolyspora sp. HNM0986]